MHDVPIEVEREAINLDEDRSDGLISGEEGYPHSVYSNPISGQVEDGEDESISSFREDKSFFM